MSEHDFGGGGATFEDLAIDDTLTDIDRVVRYVRSNIALQRVIHVRMLGETAVNAGYEKTCSLIIPVLDTLVEDSEFVVRQHLAGQFPALSKHLIENGGDAGYKLVLDKILPLTNKLLSDSQTEVRHIASESLVHIAEHIKPEDQGQHVLTLALPLAHEDDDEQMRISALILLNKLAVFLGSDLCCQFCVPEFISLSEDPVFRVRKAMALNCFHVCETAGHAVTEERLLPAYQRLSKDDVWGVRKACAESLSEFSKTLTPSSRASLLGPIFVEFTTDASKWVRIAAYQQLGPFIATLPADDIPENLTTSYLHMATQPSTLLLGGAEADMKFHCAYNYPAVTMTLGKNGWEKIAPGFDALSRDGFWKVRRTLAHSLHEMAKLLDPEDIETHLVPAFSYFLEDIDDVKMGSVQHFGEFLTLVPPHARDRFLPELSKFTELQVNPKFKLKWRFRALIAEQLSTFCHVFSPQATYEVVAPLVLQLAQDDVAMVREASFKAIPALYKALSSSDEWRSAVVKSINDFQTAPSYLTRQILGRICRAFLLGSPEDVGVFQDHFSSSFIALVTDPVFNVRLMAARILLEVASVFTLPSTEEGENAWATLQKDENADIQDAVTQLKTTSRYS